MRCLDVANGEIKWRQKIGGGALIAAGGYLLVLNERGELIVAEASPTNYRQVARDSGARRPLLGGARCGGRQDLLQE